MPFMTANWILGFACAWLFFAMGRHEARNGDAADRGIWWALASILVTVAVIQGFGVGWFLVLACQVLLYVAIAVGRVLLEKK
jgi:hypothetical protein